MIVEKVSGWLLVEPPLTAITSQRLLLYWSWSWIMQQDKDPKHESNAVHFGEDWIRKPEMCHTYTNMMSENTIVHDRGWKHRMNKHRGTSTLSNLQLSAILDHFILVVSLPWEHKKWISSEEQYDRVLSLKKKSIKLCSHSHVQSLICTETQHKTDEED